MVPELVDHLLEHPPAACRRDRRELGPVGQLRPDEDSGFVGCVEVGGIGDLDVAAQQVDAHLACEPHLLVEIGARRWCRDRVRVVVLVQRREHVDRTAVEDDPAVDRLDRAHPEAGLDLVERLAPIEQRGPHGVQIGRIDIPQPRIRHSEAHDAIARAVRRELLPRDLDTVRIANHESDRRGRRSIGIAVDRPADERLAVPDLRAHPERPQAGPRPALEGDRLPDPARARIPGLLPVGRLGERQVLLELLGDQHVLHRERRVLVDAVERIDDPHDELVLAPRPDGGADIRLEGEVAALVLADVRAVDVDACRVHHRPEAQHDPSPGPVRRDIEAAAVPGRDDPVRPRDLRFPGSRHHDRLAVGQRPWVIEPLGVGDEPPLPVEGVARAGQGHQPLTPDDVTLWTM